jgi:arsenate reductase-like glutaredoxin family protein
LRKLGIEAEELNFAKTGLERSTVLAIIAAAGGVARVVNTRHALARERGWAEKPPAAETFAAAVAVDMNLLRRPIYIAGKKVLVGYDKTNKEEWARL